MRQSPAPAPRQNARHGFGRSGRRCSLGAGVWIGPIAGIANRAGSPRHKAAPTARRPAPARPPSRRPAPGPRQKPRPRTRQRQAPIALEASTATSPRRRAGRTTRHDIPRPCRRRRAAGPPSRALPPAGPAAIAPKAWAAAWFPTRTSAGRHTRDRQAARCPPGSEAPPEKSAPAAIERRPRSAGSRCGRLPSRRLLGWSSLRPRSSS